jgi:hypothetical protein
LRKLRVPQRLHPALYAGIALVVLAALMRTRAYGGLTVLAFCAALFALFVRAVAEWLFWEEFGARFSFIAVDYLL